jgi:CubicO group peptidase (beta-lactamase class C family)
VSFGPLEDALEEGVRRGAYPRAVLLVSREGDTVFERAVGSRSLVPKPSPMRLDVVFDLSSLTKCLATTPAVLLLVRDRRLSLDDRVTRFFHNFGIHGKGSVTFRHLLCHSSGLAAHRNFFLEVARMDQAGRVNFVASRGAREWVYDQVHREKPEAPAGSRAIYSDLGFMILGQIVETISGQTLDRFCRTRIFGPLGLRALSFIDLTLVRGGRLAPQHDRIAPTQSCPWRRRIICGEVGDENAYAMGGVAGHAGLFGTARDVDALAGALENGLYEDGGLLSRDAIREMWTRDGAVPGSTRTLGWDTPSAVGSSAGTRMSSRTVGHLGFTGTSIWMDLERRIRITLLTNRVHPDRENQRIKELRPVIHDLAMEAVG